MQDQGRIIATGNVIGTFDGDDGEEIAVAVRLARAEWERLSRNCLLPDDEMPAMNGEEEALLVRIGIFLDLEIAGWFYRSEQSRSSSAGDIDEELGWGGK